MTRYIVSYMTEVALDEEFVFSDRLNAMVLRVSDGDVDGAVAAVANAPCHILMERGALVIKLVGELQRDWLSGTTLHCLLKETRRTTTSEQLNALSAAVRELLRNGASPIAVDYYGRTPLYYANHGRIFDQLVEAAETQCQVSPADYVALGQSMLMRHVSCDNVAIVEKLLKEYDVDPWMLSEGETYPIHAAGLRMIQLLAEAVGSRRAPDEGPDAAWDPESRVRAYVNLTDICGRTPLHMRSNAECVELLLQLGADVAATDMSEDAYLGTEKKYAEDPDALLAIVKATGSSGLGRTQDFSSLNSKMLQWAHGRDRPGKRTALAYAAALGTPEGDAARIVKLLLGAGASLDAVDDRGLTPLQFGSKYGTTMLWAFNEYAMWERYEFYFESDFEIKRRAQIDDHTAALNLLANAASA